MTVGSFDSQAQFLSYALDTQTWTAGSFPFAYNGMWAAMYVLCYIYSCTESVMVVFVVLSGGNLMTQFFPDVFGHLLVWENTALYYSPNRGDS